MKAITTTFLLVDLSFDFPKAIANSSNAKITSPTKKTKKPNVISFRTPALTNIKAMNLKHHIKKETARRKLNVNSMIIQGQPTKLPLVLTYELTVGYSHSQSQRII